MTAAPAPIVEVRYDLAPRAVQRGLDWTQAVIRWRGRSRGRRLADPRDYVRSWGPYGGWRWTLFRCPFRSTAAARARRGSAVLQALLDAPYDDEPVTPEETAEVEEARAERRAGVQMIPHAVVRERRPGGL